MARCSTEAKGRIFAKGYGFLSFATNMSKKFGKNLKENFSRKYS